MIRKKQGKNLRHFREMANVSIDTVAEVLDINPGLLIEYESGSLKIDYYDGLNLAAYLGFDPYFIGINVPLKKEVPKNILAPLKISPRVPFFGFFKSVFKTIFSAFRKHKKALNTDILENQLFSLEENSVQPFLFLRIALFLMIVTVLAYFADSVVISNLTLSLIVPFSLMWLLLELHHPRLVKGYELLRYFLYGGLISIIIVFLIRAFTGATQAPLAEGILTGIIEEIAKVITVVFLVRKKLIRNILEGILVGFAVGAGFSVFETTMYGINNLLSTSNFSDMMIVIIIRSVFDFIGAGHHFWTGILGGIAVMVSKSGHLKIKDLWNPVFIFWYLLMATIHGVFNFSTGYQIYYTIGVCFFSLSLFITFWVKASNDYKQSLKREEIIESDMDELILAS